jgi:hypothetical protein
MILFRMIGLVALAHYQGMGRGAWGMGSPRVATRMNRLIGFIKGLSL